DEQVATLLRRYLCQAHQSRTLRVKRSFLLACGNCVSRNNPKLKPGTTTPSANCPEQRDHALHSRRERRIHVCQVRHTAIPGCSPQVANATGHAPFALHLLQHPDIVFGDGDANGVLVRSRTAKVFAGTHKNRLGASKCQMVDNLITDAVRIGQHEPDSTCPAFTCDGQSRSPDWRL